MATYRLGINTCFAVKRWPQPERWAPWSATSWAGPGAAQPRPGRPRCAAGRGRGPGRPAAGGLRRGLTLHSTFTGLAAYSSNLLLHPDPAARERARAWYRRVIDFTAAAGAGRPAAISARTASTTGATRPPGGSCGPSSPNRSPGSPPTPATGPVRADGGEPGRRAGAVHDRDDVVAADRRRRGARAGHALPGRGAPVRARHVRGRPRPLRVAGAAGPPGARRPAAAGRRAGGPSLAVHAGDQRHRDHLGRAGAGRARRLRRHRRRAGPGGHPGVRAGRRPGAGGPGPVGPVLARCPGPACPADPPGRRRAAGRSDLRHGRRDRQLRAAVDAHDRGDGGRTRDPPRARAAPRADRGQPGAGDGGRRGASGWPAGAVGAAAAGSTPLRCAATTTRATCRGCGRRRRRRPAWSGSSPGCRRRACRWPSPHRPRWPRSAP